MSIKLHEKIEASVNKYFTKSVFRPGNAKLIHLTNFTEEICYVRLLWSKRLSLENKFLNLKRKLCISFPLKQYYLALQISQRPPCLPYLSQCVHSRHLSQLILNQSKSSLNEVHSKTKKKSKFSLEPCALNFNSCETCILRYNYKSSWCFTFWNSHSESPRCLN